VSTTRTGRDGRPLVTTTMAAYSLGMQPASFRGWAVRNGVRSVRSLPNPKGGQPTALWDLADITAALDKTGNPA
jgi:hypothetical protein